jgi:cytochrome c oxidase cbb3-type subunit 3
MTIKNTDMENSENKNLNNKKERDIIIPDHDFDGIKEYNNPPPPWLMYIFYFTVLFSAIYWVHYHTFGTGPSQAQEYIDEVKKAEIKYNINQVETDAPLVALTDEESLQKGKELYQKHSCYTCHGNVGEGNAIGPNLTDDYWIHGGEFEDIVMILEEGNITKGMQSFRNLMVREQLIQVASYIVSLQGSNPTNAKAPEGEKFSQ